MIKVMHGENSSTSFIRGRELNYAVRSTNRSTRGPGCPSICALRMRAIGFCAQI